MDLDDLLEAVEADEDEAVFKLGGGGLLRGDLVQEEAVEGERLLVDHVLHADAVVRAERGRGARRMAPVLAQGRLLHRVEGAPLALLLTLCEEQMGCYIFSRTAEQIEF